MTGITSYDTTDHYTPGLVTGSHSATWTGLNATCHYSGTGLQPDCSTDCAVNNSTDAGEGEVGQTRSTLCHQVASNWSDGTGSADYTGTSCTGNAGWGAGRCSSFCNCSVTETFIGGMWTSSTIGGTTLIAKDIPATKTCATVADPLYVACTGTPAITCEQQCGGGNDPVVCSHGTWKCADGSAGCSVPPPNLNCSPPLGPTCSGSTWSCGNGCYSPIIIDTDGGGFHLTSAANGVLFDLTATGHPIQIGWTAPGSTNGWLALDRNHNGTIDNGKELFGNYTAQAPCSDPNGFLALAVFDQPASGGNGDGVIDKLDSIWPQLLVWIDANHDGVSQSGELHNLDALGIHSISLQYSKSPFTDVYGNQFRYKGMINVEPGQGGTVNHTIYDVFLVTAGRHNGSNKSGSLGNFNKLE